MIARSIRRAWSAIEPWYNWGRWVGSSTKDERGGDGRFFEIEWFGLQVVIAVSYYPKAKVA